MDEKFLRKSYKYDDSSMLQLFDWIFWTNLRQLDRKKISARLIFAFEWMIKHLYHKEHWTFFATVDWCCFETAENYWQDILGKKSFKVASYRSFSFFFLISNEFLSWMEFNV